MLSHSSADDLAVRLARLAHRILPNGLAEREVTQLADYLRLLERWNQTINLTALPLQEFPDASIDRLVGEPLAAAAHIRDTGATWFDLGSGGGSPAIPLKIVCPTLELFMVESRSRKAAFLSEAVRRLELRNTQVLNARFEELEFSHGETADLLTVRAVGLDDTFLAAALGIIKPGGRLMVFTTTDNAWSPAVGFVHTSETPLPTPDAVLRIWRRSIE